MNIGPIYSSKRNLVQPKNCLVQPKVAIFLNYFCHLNIMQIWVFNKAQWSSRLPEACFQAVFKLCLGMRSQIINTYSNSKKSITFFCPPKQSFKLTPRKVSGSLPYHGTCMKPHIGMVSRIFFSIKWYFYHGLCLKGKPWSCRHPVVW